MTRVLIWDLPVRLFHGFLTLLILAALGISLLVHDSSPWYPYHSVLALIAAPLIVLRIAWGFVGTRHARFWSFLFSPKAVAMYFIDALRWRETRHAGHNPGAAYVVILMMLLPLMSVLSGYQLGQGNKQVKEFHEILAYVLLALIGAHIVGIILHTLRHKELIAVSMLDGKKQADPAQAIPSSRPIAGLLFLLFALWWGAMIYRGYDTKRGVVRLPVVGMDVKVEETGFEDEHEE
ncbi:MAG: cytochrome b/b6 domain-containing protein [Phycisphaerales bacterium]|nr:cytochrome b/b6 domain-containing protein [Phycisphaerales bacterium]